MRANCPEDWHVTYRSESKHASEDKNARRRSPHAYSKEKHFRRTSGAGRSLAALAIEKPMHELLYSDFYVILMM